MRNACSDHTSLIGFDPWYAGRSAGRSGSGRPVYGIAVNDSIAWLRMSRPLEAATSGGIVRVLSGSSTPSVGFNRRLAMPVFACKIGRASCREGVQVAVSGDDADER